MNILITGVAGMIGSRLADYIIENHSNVTVVGLDDLSGGYFENVNNQVNFIKKSCNENLEDIFNKFHFDYVYHLAAYAAEGLSPFIRKFNYTNNLIATANIINNCIKFDIKRLVFTSSIAVYGHGIPPFKESDIPKPSDPYGVAKYACEMDIQIAGEQHGLDWCILRPHNVYGVKQNIWDKYRNVLGIWMYQYLNGGKLTIFGDGKQKRAFTYIDDCLLPLWNAAILHDSSRQIINVGSEQEYNIIDTADILMRVMGGGIKDFKESRFEVKDAWSDHTKAKTILGYKDIYTLKEGLTNMWAWAKQQPKRNQKIWDYYEINNGLYPTYKK